MATNYRQIMKIKAEYEKKIREACPCVTDNAGIYVFWRIDENGFKFGYVGQALHLCKRLVDHMMCYQHIDNSIRKHKLYDEEKNPHGYHIEIIEECSPEDLDERERYWIKYYADQGYQLRNKTSGGQDGEKSALGEGKSNKGYRDGLVQGRKNTQKEIKELFDKYLTYDIKGKPGKIKQRKYDEFTAFLNEDKAEEEDEI
jgi:hypothetical protein